MEIDPISFIGTIIAIIGILAEHFYFQAKLQERIAVLETKQKCMEGMEGDVREIKTKIDLFWGALEKQIPGLLMRGNPIEPGSRLYELLGRLQTHQITNSELKELSKELESEIKRPDHSPGEKLAMIFTEALVRSKVEVYDGSAYCSI